MIKLCENLPALPMQEPLYFPLYPSSFKRQVVQEYLSAHPPPGDLARKHNIGWNLIPLWSAWHRAGEPDTGELVLPEIGSAAYFRDEEHRLIAETYIVRERRLWMLWIIIAVIEAGFCGSATSVGTSYLFSPRL